MRTPAAAPDGVAATLSGRPPRRLLVATLFLAVLAAIVVLAAVHITQGTSGVNATDLLGLVFGGEDQQALRVLVASRMPRLAAALAVGIALGVSGAVLQSVARNHLASPDTLAVNAGAHLTVTFAAVVGLSLPMLPAGMLTFAGGLAAAGLVMAMAGGGSGTTRLILAGTATALAFHSLTMLLIILNDQTTVGLFAWGSGSLLQTNMAGFWQAVPVIGVAVLACLFLAPKLDILTLGDDTATVLGVKVTRTRVIATVLAVLLAATAVAVAGPVGFVGLCAPVVVRLLSRLAPGLARHRVLIPMAGLAGVVIVIGADVVVRAIFGAAAGIVIPVGVATSVLGAVVLVWLARRHRDAGGARQPATARIAMLRSRVFVTVLVTGLLVAVVAGFTLGMLGGDTWVLTGDVLNWLTGNTGPGFTHMLDQRFPRVLAALLGGAALAISGTVVQSVGRNPLADPGILGITGGAGLAAVIVISLYPAAGIGVMTVAIILGALLAFALVYGLAWRGGLNSDRLILIGVGVSTGVMALVTFIIVYTDPWNSGKALTWLSGTTYGRTLDQLVPVGLALAVIAPLVFTARREMDLLALDEDTPRVLGVRLERTRLGLLVAAALLAATAVAAVGVIGFVGLVAPHAARALVGSRHVRVLPVAALLGALLVSLSDSLGRTVIAPAQIPAGLVTAIIGTPYFLWLLWRSRTKGTIV
ncbi:iron ABC transporter permease [Stackebrandtia nassauensis]|uniref:Transport system permease protein n=1 Tax=Stackebrandtia nassauensis (strain DSM 44728 / CIP 108903 / NRRL B-16338 / NBRC 102104 / LLR-40K-21) TaxID=446470 RepID=D3PYT8_STANL|nr:iron ABC transporter permease [Stackebrandtia nassauensis]ADD43521.1 transport system permease protein [Stackebrandtia nassauensis DSM 44728]